MTAQFILSLMCFAAGVGTQKLRMAGEKAVTVLSSLISWVLLPAVIVAAMNQLHLSKDVMLLPAANLFVVGALLIVAALTARFAGVKRPTAGAAVIAFGSLEGGSIGLALVLSLFGTRLLPQFFVFDVVHALLLFTLTYLIACVYGGEGKLSGKLIRGFLLGPIPIAVVAGLLLNVSGIGINSGIDSLLNAAGYLILPAVLAILGLRFTFRKEYLAMSLVLTFAKIVLGYLIALAFVLLFEPSASSRAVILLSSCLPPSFLTLIFAQERKLDTGFLATFLPVSALISFTVLYATFQLFPSLL
jgi:predicted permease